jgi:hypothetical protein
MNQVKRVNGLHLTHIVTDDNVTFCGKEAGMSWVASGNATCVECLCGPLINSGDVDGAVQVVLDLPYTSDKRVASSVTTALAICVAARLSSL